jgi:cell wall-associated NlpC family hydrolase
MNHLRAILTVSLLAMVSAFAQQERDPMIDGLLREARDLFVPDRRTAVFDVKGELQGSVLTLRGEIQNEALKDDLLRFLKEKKDLSIVDSLVTLPHPALGEKTYGVVSLSVANIRSKPDHPAEMVTQAILGTPLSVLKTDDGWYYVQTPDRYLGWTDDRIAMMTQKEFAQWTAMPKVIVTSDIVFTHRTAEEGSPRVSDVVIGSILAVKADSGSGYEVQYPDGRTGFLAKNDAQPYEEWLAQAHDTPENILRTAERFTGIPYLWGGTSCKGLDCSGFTKTVFFLNGTLLPRDANQQALVGEPVDTTGGWSALKPGDLLFFGARATADRRERVTHVAISLGGARFIHSSGIVGTNSFNPADPDYSKHRERSFLRARRIIGAGEGTGVQHLSTIPYYNGHAD